MKLIVEDIDYMEKVSLSEIRKKAKYQKIFLIMSGSQELYNDLFTYAFKHKNGNITSTKIVAEEYEGKLYCGFIDFDNDGKITDREWYSIKDSKANKEKFIQHYNYYKEYKEKECDEEIRLLRKTLR